MFQNLAKRSITSIFLLIGVSLWMLIGAVYLEPKFKQVHNLAAYLFMAINSGLLLIAVWEIINLKKNEKWPVIVKIYTFIFALLFLWMPIGIENYVFYKYINNQWFSPLISFLLLFSLVILFYLLTLRKKNFSTHNFYFIIAWIFYLVLMFKGINFLMLQGTNIYQFGWPTLLYIWIIVMCNDVGGYIGGSLFGKHLLAPKISPKKTWEGAISGLLLSTVFSMTFVVLILQMTTYRILPLYEGQLGMLPIYFFYLGFSLVFGIISQFGDLLFSVLKRQHGVKDFSKIFPGHGGLLDRLDGFSLVIIFAYAVTNLLIVNF